MPRAILATAARFGCLLVVCVSFGCASASGGFPNRSVNEQEDLKALAELYASSQVIKDYQQAPAAQKQAKRNGVRKGVGSRFDVVDPGRYPQGMPRRKRITPGGYVYHVLNRGVGRMTIFNKPEDYQAFIGVLVETCDRRPDISLLGYCLMPNHWHLLLRPKRGGDLSEFMRLLTVTHTQRYHAHHRTAGTGPVYQGRFKSFPVEDDGYFLTVARYVEGNALRAGLVERAEDWRWSSLHARREGPDEVRTRLAPWPVAGVPGGVPRQWLRTVNAALTQKQLDAVRASVRRGRPLGEEGWVEKTAAKMGLGSTLRGPGRPRKEA